MKAIALSRRRLMAGATSITAWSIFNNAQWAQPAFAKTSDANSTAFRNNGGTVAVFFYGGWTQHGALRNPSPWYWINHGHKQRLPLRSVNLPGHWLKWPFAPEEDEERRAVSHLTVRDADMSSDGDGALFTPTGPLPRIESPFFHAGRGAHYPAIRFKVQRGNERNWRCALTFSTWADPTAKWRVEIPEPNWLSEKAEINVDLRTNQIWMEGDIRNIGIELGSPGDGNYILTGYLELIPSIDLEEELSNIEGLPQDKLWAADWQITEAAKYGIDAFMMCTYWNGKSSRNKNVIDIMFASEASPAVKLGLYFDSAASVRPKSLSDLDDLLISWNEYFGMKRFWRINGRPVLGWHGGESTRDFLSLVPEFRSETPDQRLISMVKYIRRFFKEYRYSNAQSGVFLLSGFMVDDPYWTGDSKGAKGLWDRAGFDAGTVYNQFSSFSSRRSKGLCLNNISSGGMPFAEDFVNFDRLNEIYKESADWILENSRYGIPYFMPAIAGWDPRPWEILYPRTFNPCSAISRTTANEDKFRNHLMSVRDRAIFHASTKVNNPIVFINAWDEFGEGSFICPSRQFGTSRLESVRSVFGIRTA